MADEFQRALQMQAQQLRMLSQVYATDALVGDRKPVTIRGVFGGVLIGLLIFAALFSLPFLALVLFGR
ncbi:hypothetical protein [Nitrospirillum bahiense]|uniref:Tetrahydromethanopterin S-methyltransferase n=1 Tax=Nitrospirillum amazonense TaxID=28077 RepID=A0A560FVY6_9PROT|nr:hypothetical protein [Nitrospirillum amazonense]TWB25721.1 hypothetical protein FBZ88_109118 [Nitrospirillum amazonense]